jgi:capsular exopolysaccharide synthesis family protein
MGEGPRIPREESGSGYSPLRGYVAAFRRRKWIVLLALVLAPAVAVAYSLTQPKRYEATAKVLLSNQSLAGVLSGAGNLDVYQDPNRLAQTQLEIARVPTLANRVIRETGLEGATAETFLDDSQVVAGRNADILEFRVEAGLPAIAERLATAYAVEFTKYRRELETAAFTHAERGVQRRLRQLKASGEKDSRLYESLLERDEQLRTLATLGTSNAVLLRSADEATQVQPRPVRNGILAGVLGLLLGLMAAGIAEALDTRTRSSDEIAEVLQLPFLGRLPKPARRRRNRPALAMLASPAGPEAEAFRIFRANVDFLLKSADRRTIMVTSALGVEGKSTTLANLAVALALAGRHVVAVDLDLRRPSLGRLFGLPDSPGATEVASGSAMLEDALLPVPLSTQPSANGRRAERGRVEVLPAGACPPDPGEFVARESVSDLLHRLRSRADIVLVDTPPLLNVGDAVTLSAAVDGVLLVVRPNVARRDELGELRRVLSSAQADTLGFVLTGSRAAEMPGYGSYYAR